MKIRSISSALVAGLLHLGCAGSMAPKDSQAPDSPAAASPVAASKAELPKDPREKHWASQIAFIDDDYARAKQDGTAQRRPIFIDSWATWCHTCLSMRSFVLPDAGLRGVKDSVTWLSIETEQEKNRAFVEKFPAEGLPTFLIVDPDDEQILGRWLGSGSTNEMRGFVEAGVAAYRAKRGGPAQSEAARLQRMGDVAAIKGDVAASAGAYRKAAELTPKSDSLRSVRLDLLAGALSHAHADGQAACVELGNAELDEMPANAVGADFAATVAGCAQGRVETKKDDLKAKGLLGRATARLVAMTNDPSAPFSVDDRSDVQASLAELQKEQGDEKASEATLRKREKLLEDAAAKAPDAETAATFDAHRTDCYVALHELDKAEQMLGEREKQLPDDYNPPARLARVLLEGKKFALAETQVDRALALMTTGPRRVGILGLKARILAAQGKPTESVLREQLSVLRALPSPQRRPQAEADIEKQLAAPAKS